MTTMGGLNLALPGNPRYQPRNLLPFFGYDNLYRGVGLVEIANIQTLGEIGIIPPEEMVTLVPELIEAILAIPTTTVDRIERQITGHDVRAWIREAQQIIQVRLKRWVHVLLTSYDPLDTGRILLYLRAYHEAVKPALKQLILTLVELVREFADQIQMGRTHGQHALPITVGFWLATILNRILYNLEEMDFHAERLVGKISGAVGAYNAQVGLGIAELCGEKTFEQRVLERVGLKPGRISTQVLAPEPLAYFLHSCTMMTASLGQFARDVRHLMRTEIGEITEPREEGQVGSSTMFKEANPINFENVEGTWHKTKWEHGKVLETLVSEHQRDGVGMTIARDLPIIVVNLQHQIDTLLREPRGGGDPFLRRMTINRVACERNFAQTAHLVLAEPVYIALQMGGYEKDAHRLINDQLGPIARSQQRMLMEVVEEYAEGDGAVRVALQNMPPQIRALLHQPRQYTGSATQKALEIAALAEERAASM